MQSKQLHSRFEQLFYNTGVGVGIVDKERFFIEVNPKFCEMLGYSREEIVGSSAELVHVDHGTYVEFGEKAFELVLKNKSTNLEWQLKLKDGTLKTFRIAGDPVENADEVLWTFVDISERISAQKELEQKNIQLGLLTNKLSKYLSPQLYKSIFTGKKDVKVETVRKKLSVFFSDIHGFTELTDSIEPEILEKFLNQYLNEMSIIALKYEGTIDKFIGDAILVFFGDPESHGEKKDAILCVKMALEMKEKLKELRKIWKNTGLFEPLKIRIGINTGYCNVGNFGSTDRMDYTIIGGQVNVASRLETNAELDQILISHETYVQVQDVIMCNHIGAVQVKGIAHSIETYEVICLKEEFIPDNQLLSKEMDGFSIKIDIHSVEKAKAISFLGEAINALRNS
ncbi:MAG: PAS domain S-box protein [Fibrobacterales bacterium]